MTDHMPLLRDDRSRVLQAHHKYPPTMPEGIYDVPLFTLDVELLIL